MQVITRIGIVIYIDGLIGQMRSLQRQASHNQARTSDLAYRCF